MSNVLVISPHPDDESIGCGGKLRWHAQRRDRVHVVFLTSGEKGGHGKTPDQTRTIREREAAAAAKILGLASFEFWHMPDGSVRATPAAVTRLISTIRRLRPNRLYVPHHHEMHPDHRAAARLVKTAMQKLGSKNSRPVVLMYELWTPLREFDHTQDISDQVQTKLAAIRAHKSQCAVMDFAQAARGLARYRGEFHLWPGGDWAEVFLRMRP